MDEASRKIPAPEVRAASEACTGALYPWRHLGILPLYPARGLAVEWALRALGGLALGLGARHVRVVRLGVRVLVLVLVPVLFVAVLLLEPRHPAAAHRALPQHRAARPRAALVRRGAPPRARPRERALSLAVIAAELALPVLCYFRPRLGLAGVVVMHAGFALVVPGVRSFGLAMIAMAKLYVVTSDPAPSAASRRR